MGKVGPINLSVLVQAPPSYRPFSRLAEDAIPKRLPRLTDNASLSSPKKSAGYTQPYNWIMAAGNYYLRGDEAREKKKSAHGRRFSFLITATRADSGGTGCVRKDGQTYRRRCPFRLGGTRFTGPLV
jgi:hypothetical protein